MLCYLRSHTGGYVLCLCSPMGEGGGAMLAQVHIQAFTHRSYYVVSVCSPIGDCCVLCLCSTMGVCDGMLCIYSNAFLQEGLQCVDLFNYRVLCYVSKLTHSLCNIFLHSPRRRGRYFVFMLAHGHHPFPTSSITAKQGVTHTRRKPNSLPSSALPYSNHNHPHPSSTLSPSAIANRLTQFLLGYSFSM